MHAISVRSAYIDLNELDGCVFVNNTIITTNPQLDIVCSRLRELLTEPRWIVDYTAVMCARWLWGSPVRLWDIVNAAKIIITHKRRDSWTGIDFPTNKTPDVFPWQHSVRETDTVKIYIVYAIVPYAIRWALTISSDSSTDNRKWYAMCRVCGGHTPSCWPNPAANTSGCSWRLNKSFVESFWAVLVGIGHVKVGYPHPSSCSVAATACSIHVTVDLNRRASTVSGNPVFSRWSVLRDVTTRACWIIKCSYCRRYLGSCSWFCWRVGSYSLCTLLSNCTF